MAKKQTRIPTKIDGIYHVERKCRTDKARMERVWIGRWTDETVTPRKQREAVLGREISGGMDIRAAKVKLDEFKAGTAKTTHQIREEEKKSDADKRLNTLNGFWEIYLTKPKAGILHTEKPIYKTDRTYFYHVTLDPSMVSDIGP
jgi:hypothetical protein